MSATHAPQPTRVALVTGANRGIGFEVCRQLAGRGDAVVLCARDPDRAGRAVAELARAGCAGVWPQYLDVTDQQSIDDAARAVDERFGRLDVLVNNAAIGFDPHQRVLGVEPEALRAILDTNLVGAWLTIRAFAPLLERSEHGRVVNVSSSGGSFGSSPGLTFRGTAAYGVSKAGLNALTVKLALELRDRRILVNAVCPGHTATTPGASGRPVADGAAGIVWAACLPDDGPTGGFFEDGTEIPW